jgi:hypothetical protein
MEKFCKLANSQIDNAVKSLDKADSKADRLEASRYACEVTPDVFVDVRSFIRLMSTKDLEIIANSFENAERRLAAASEHNHFLLY